DPLKNRTYTFRTFRMPLAGVVVQCHRVGRYNHLHRLTLPQMSSRLVVEGVWPETVTVSKGWSRGEARPWNNETGDGHLRLIRGSSIFLEEATALVAASCGGTVYSPAL